VAHVRRHLPELLEPWPDLAAEARGLAGRTFELSQFLHRILGAAGPLGPGLGRPYAYHPSCGLHRVLGEDRAPYALLDALPGPRRVALPRAEVCCGFGGPFAVTHPGLSSRLLADKLEAVAEAGVELLVVGDVGCFVHLACGAEESWPELEVLHLDQALAGGEGA
jgi:L-lactate dehydrogenase complex protein LldE